MPSKFNTENFEPVHLKKAKHVLEKHLQVVSVHKKIEANIHEKELEKLSFWQKFLNFIKLG